jgi:citrate lyase subunit beta/citryl-CoA lyase
VAPSAKPLARKLARRWIPKLAGGRRRVFVRINSVRSGLARDDLLAVVDKKTAGVVVPKVESAQQLRDLDVLIREAELEAGVRPGDIRVVPLIESALAVLRCEEIARASDRVVALSIGAEDYAADLGIERRADGVGLEHIRGTVVQVAVAYGMLPIDSPYTDYRDAAGLAADAALARSLGLKAKYAIHPDQVGVINKTFTPSAAEAANAQRIVDAYERGIRSGAGAVSLDGRMIDAPIAERARAIIAAAKRR